MKTPYLILIILALVSVSLISVLYFTKGTLFTVGSSCSKHSDCASDEFCMPGTQGCQKKYDNDKWCPADFTIDGNRDAICKSNNCVESLGNYGLCKPQGETCTGDTKECRMNSLGYYDKWECQNGVMTWIGNCLAGEECSIVNNNFVCTLVKCSSHSDCKSGKFCMYTQQCVNKFMDGDVCYADLAIDHNANAVCENGKCWIDAKRCGSVAPDCRSASYSLGECESGDENKCGLTHETSLYRCKHITSSGFDGYCWVSDLTCFSLCAKKNDPCESGSLINAKCCEGLICKDGKCDFGNPIPELPLNLILSAVFGIIGFVVPVVSIKKKQRTKGIIIGLILGLILALACYYIFSYYFDLNSLIGGLT